MKLNWITLTLAQAGSTESAPPSLPPADGAAPVTQTDAGTTSAPAGTTPTTTPVQPNPLFQMLLPAVIGAMVLMFIFSGRKQKKKQAEREAMIEAIKKGDKVQTIGGIRGTVVEAREDEIVVKVDENSNTKMRFARNAVSTLLDAKGSGKEE